MNDCHRCAQSVVKLDIVTKGRNLIKVSVRTSSLVVVLPSHEMSLYWFVLIVTNKHGALIPNVDAGTSYTENCLVNLLPHIDMLWCHSLGCSLVF